jgi:aspartate/methionine/tyrosine aminotransferase
MPRDASLNPLAVELNHQLAEAAPEVLEMLSGLGRRLYFPKGILSQSAEAKERGHTANATIGIATEEGGPMVLPSLARHIQGIGAADAFPYAPPAGRMTLRKRWREKMLEENPSLAGKRFGLPITTSAITHGLQLVGDLFVDPGDCLLLPDKLWGNYRLLFGVRLGAEIATFPLYKGAGIDTAAFESALSDCAADHEKLVVLLNFPNNPTGYMPTRQEGDALVRALVARAEKGTKVIALIDDAYFGLFYHLGGESMTESLFATLANAHPNLMAVRLDGATKELFVWGLRCGFVTFAPGRADSADSVCAVLDAKARGAIRSGISSSCHLSQTMVETALASSSIADERKEKRETLRARAQKVFEVVNEPRFKESWKVYPFNSGYFMCVEVIGADAEKVRVKLLDDHGMGVIATSPTDIRVAFSCLEIPQVEPLFAALHQTIQELRNC